MAGGKENKRALSRVMYILCAFFGRAVGWQHDSHIQRDRSVIAQRLAGWHVRVQLSGLAGPRVCRVKGQAMEPADLGAAAAVLEGAAGAGPVAWRVLGTLRPGADNSGDGGLLRWLRIGARTERVFLLAPPLAPGGVLCGAAMRPDAGGPAVHLAGFGPTPRQAFVRAMAEAAEAEGLAVARRSRAALLPGLDAGLQPVPGVAPSPLLDDGAGVAAGEGPARAARGALLEALERHALALWVCGRSRAGRLVVPAFVRQFESVLRAGRADLVGHMRFLLIPSLPGCSVVAAVSDACDEGAVVGYGCDPDPVAACCKAVIEAVMAEAGLMLSIRAHAQGTSVPEDGALARVRWFAQRPDLICPGHDADWPRAGPDDLVALAAGARLTVRFADLSLPGRGITVLKAAVPGLSRLCEHVPVGASGPL